MTLTEITALEYEWLERTPDKGSIEQRHTLCEQMGIYDAWRGIFQQYVICARQGDGEALKRALFLFWYSLAEPSWLSGISALDHDLVKEVLGIANEVARRRGLDAELKWMLPYYYKIADFYLDSQEDFDELKKASRQHANAWRARCLESSFDNRGQMGQYWESIQKNVRM